jgi:hypothetical protein
MLAEPGASVLAPEMLRSRALAETRNGPTSPPSASSDTVAAAPAAPRRPRPLVAMRRIDSRVGRFPPPLAPRTARPDPTSRRGNDERPSRAEEATDDGDAVVIQAPQADG